MLIKSADDKSKRLALLQDLQQSPMLDAAHKKYFATCETSRAITKQGKMQMESLLPTP